jgi:hypothetical protein
MPTATKQAQADCERALELDRIIKGAQGERNPLKPYHDHHAPTEEERRVKLEGRKAARRESKRRRLSRYAFLLWREAENREGTDISEEERGQLVTTLTAVRRLVV